MQTMKTCLGSCARDEEKFGEYKSKRLAEMEAETLRRADERIKYLQERLHVVE